MRYALIVILLGFLFNVDCTAQRKFFLKGNGNVELVKMESDVITFRCHGNGKKKDAALRDAPINAFKILLFRGVPESSYAAPMVSVNEADELSKHKAYFDKLLGGGRYSSFVTASTVLAGYDSKTKTTILEISINTRALKADLVSNKILSDYGF